MNQSCWGYSTGFYPVNYNALIICCPVSRPPGTLGEHTGTQGESNSVGISFFPTGEGSCLFLETTSLDHGDKYPQDLFEVVQQASALPGTKINWSMCENEQKAGKKKWIPLFVIFANEIKILWFNKKRLKKVVMSFLTTSKRYHVVGDSILSPRERLFVIYFVPFCQGLFDSPEKTIPQPWKAISQGCPGDQPIGKQMMHA